MHRNNRSSFDHLVREQLHRVGNREAQGLCSLEIDDEFEFGRLLHRKVSRLLSPDNSPGVVAGLAIRARKVGSVAHKPACDGKLTHRIYRRNRMARCERNNVIAVCDEERIGSDKKRSAGELGRRFRSAQPTISRHLKVLERAGLVQRIVEGRVHRFELRQSKLAEARAWIARHQAFWEGAVDQLDRILSEPPRHAR